MNVAAVGFVPGAPLLVPDLAGEAAHHDADLRNACLDVIDHLATTATSVCVLAPWPGGGEWPAEASWDFAGFGVSRRTPPSTALAWPLGVGAWLLDAAGWSSDRRYVGVDAVTTLPDGDARVALLAVADGSARRSIKAPGYLDDRAEPFDAAIATAIEQGDPAAFFDIDSAMASELLCTGLAVWRLIAASRLTSRVADARLLWAGAPYGVGYFAGYWIVERELGRL